MRSYLEVADRVFERGEIMRAEQKQKMGRVIRLSTSVAACFVIGFAVLLCVEKGIIKQKEQLTIEEESNIGDTYIEDGVTSESAAVIEEKIDLEDEKSNSDSLTAEPVKEADNGEMAYRVFDTDNSQGSPGGSEQFKDRDQTIPETMEESVTVYNSSSQILDPGTFGPEDGEIIVSDAIKNKLIETSSSGLVKVRIQLYKNTVLVTDLDIYRQETQRLNQYGIIADVEESEGQFYLLAEIGSGTVSEFPCGVENGYAITEIVG